MLHMLSVNAMLNMLSMHAMPNMLSVHVMLNMLSVNVTMNMLSVYVHAVSSLHGGRPVVSDNNAAQHHVCVYAADCAQFYQQ